MKILVCCKQVPAGTALIDPATHGLIRDRIPLTMNPADANALETALAIKDQTGAFVTVLTMGKQTASEMLLQAAALGADELCLLSDPAFSGSDTFVTASLLAKAAKRLGDFSLILCGDRTTDGETGQVGPELAALLGMEVITGCCSVSLCQSARSVLCARRLEEDTLSLSAALPVVLTISEGTNRPRLPTISGIRRSKSAEIHMLNAADLSVSSRDCGFQGSPTRVIAARPYTGRQRHTRHFYKADGAPKVAGLIRQCQRLPAGREFSENENVEPDGNAEQNPHPKEVWVYCESRGTEITPDSLALLGKAVSVCRQHLAASAVLLGPCSDSMIRLLFASGAKKVYCCRMSPSPCERAAALSISRLSLRYQPEILLFPSTISSKCIAAQTAACLRTGLTADCTALSIDSGGLLVQTRPAYGGNLTADILCQTQRPQMATVKSGIYSPPLPDYTRTGAVIPFAPVHFSSQIKLLSRTAVFIPAALSCAGIVVAGGAGIGSAENFNILVSFAEKIGAAPGASRAAVNAGYARPEYQIGQSGTVVRPRLYIAVAISGAVQHLAGISNSQYIVAINRDPAAPILSYADYAMVCDWREGLAAILSACETAQPLPPDPNKQEVIR